jgi:hypothetical protein
MHGDALDVQNVSGTQAEWDAIAKAATDAHAIYIESVAEGGIGHVHADWRNQ